MVFSLLFKHLLKHMSLISRTAVDRISACIYVEKCILNLSLSVSFHKVIDLYIKSVALYVLCFF